MDEIRLVRSSGHVSGSVRLPGSKSESNRALIINSLAGGILTIRNLSDADDTKILEKALNGIPHEINVGHAGTAMRFLAARLSLAPGDFTLSGSERMHHRPIGPLIDAINSIGGNIRYLGKTGFPPLKIKGGSLRGGKLAINGNISSQFLSALAMIAPYTDKGLEICFGKQLVSKPYLLMTLELMQQCGAEYHLQDDRLHIPAGNYRACNLNIESDWSSASYWYSIAALADSADLFLEGLRKKSLQGDAVVSKIFRLLGVLTTWENGGARLQKERGIQLPSNLELNCEEFPDLVQTLAVTLAGLGIEVRFTGIGTLALKETDRIAALSAELAKTGIRSVAEGREALTFFPGEIVNPGDPIKTYDDHRMALAFAPAVLKTGSLRIAGPQVVSKSYPGFFSDLVSCAVCSIS